MKDKCPCSKCISLAICVSLNKIRCESLWEYCQSPFYREVVKTIFPKVHRILPDGVHPKDWEGVFDHEIGIIL